MSLMLSVSGLRGVVGDTLKPELVAKYAQAAAIWFKSESNDSSPHILIGRDSRPSGPMVEAAVISGLLASGCKVTQLGITSTPGVGFRVQEMKAQGGIVITASHNPIPWNGVKIISSEGAAPSKANADQIIAAFHSNDAALVDAESIGEVKEDDQTDELHAASCLKLVDMGCIQNKRFKVVLHSVHGAGGPGTAAMLEKLNVDLVHLFAEPTGIFPHAPEPTAENLSTLCQAVKEHGADIGLAQDPDADRLAIVDENGHYIGEEYTLALLTHHVMQQRPGRVVANLSTSRMVDDIAAKYGQSVYRSAVGEANVVAGMREHDAVIGGEGNGGIIDPRVGWIRDSYLGIALILDALACSERSVSALVNQFPSYAMIKSKQPIQPGMYESAKAKLLHAYGHLQIDQQDGIRVDWSDRWAHVRASNTEPILRLIVEAPTQDEARALVNEVSAVISGAE